MTVAAIQSGSIIAGPTLPEAVEVLVVTPFGEASKVIGKGLRSGKIYDTVFSPAQLSQLTVSTESEPFDGDARLFRLGIEAQRLGLAYEYDPFFSLSIASVESVESDNRGFDLISRRPDPKFAGNFLEVRFIEVKGRAGVGVVALSENEYRTAQRLRDDYWLYAVFNCTSCPEVHVVRDPAMLGWHPVLAVEHYQLGPSEIIGSSSRMGDS
ncbi:MAG: DUF3883 domain-containing protein [Planctomycetaceae bacterium]